MDLPEDLRGCRRGRNRKGQGADPGGGIEVVAPELDAELQVAPRPRRNDPDPDAGVADVLLGHFLVEDVG